ncbi:MAG TPA: hypothetical protein VN902_05920 [Candidatus Acidoferrales bacterium]|jgi:hypothetical protein|nr:hypothetical protein [Candidatus Acidoferrales bacterium]
MAADFPREGFEQITKQLGPRGFGNSKTAATFQREAKKMCDPAKR